MIYVCTHTKLDRNIDSSKEKTRRLVYFSGYAGLPAIQTINAMNAVVVLVSICLMILMIHMLHIPAQDSCMDLGLRTTMTWTGAVTDYLLLDWTWSRDLVIS